MNKEDFSWVVDVFNETVGTEGSSEPMGVVQALSRVISTSKAQTIMGLISDVRNAVNLLLNANNSIAVNSTCDLFKKYVSRTWLDLKDFDLLKTTIENRSEKFKRNMVLSQQKISKLGDNFIRDGMKILTHGYSNVVIAILEAALAQGKRFSVIATESRPYEKTSRTVSSLLEKGVPVTLIADSTVAYVMSTVDLVLVGAEAVVENGGILNTIGTYQISIVAKALGKPFYVACQSYKFTRIYPLNQTEIPNNDSNEEESTISSNTDISSLVQKYNDTLNIEQPPFDYTPPIYITLLFTDLGILTPAGVSDELIKLYT